MQSVYKPGLHPGLLDPAADVLSSAVNDDRLKAYQLQKHHILDHVHLQGIVGHGAAAVFYNNDLAVEPLDIREGFDEHLGLMHDL